MSHHKDDQSGARDHVTFVPTSTESSHCHRYREGDKSYSAPPRGVAWEPSLRRRAKQRGISGLRLAMKVVQASQPTLRGASEVFPTGFPSVRATCLHGRGKCALSSTFRQFSLHLLSSQSSYIYLKPRFYHLAAFVPTGNV